jgi:tRNA(Ile2) C34 agmatinyltransferase TiaS
MITIGIDDTDMLDTPGTNKLARHLVDSLRNSFTCRMIVRHQLLEDPRVPCTRKNGCASIQLERRDRAAVDATQLADRIRPIVLAWCPAGSDPGLCIASAVPATVVEWGRRCQRELVTQFEAFDLAATTGIQLEGLGGTNDGVIGALAAVGLAATADDGRVVYLGAGDEDLLDVTGDIPVSEIRARGINEIRDVHTSASITAGVVSLKKQLRPNYRAGLVVLYVAQIGDGAFEEVRVT